MAGFGGIAAVGTSLERLLTRAFAERSPIPGATPTAKLIRTDDLKETNGVAAIGSNVLSIFLYRVDFDRTMRTAWAAAGSGEGRSHLALMLHYLLTPWAANAEHEQMILGRALQAMEELPTLTGPLFTAPPTSLPDEPEISATESVSLMLEEISTEALMRIFDSLPTDYRISVAYVARVVRIVTREMAPVVPVTDARTRIGVPAWP